MSTVLLYISCAQGFDSSKDDTPIATTLLSLGANVAFKVKEKSQMHDSKTGGYWEEEVNHFTYAQYLVILETNFMCFK